MISVPIDQPCPTLSSSSSAQVSSQDPGGLCPTGMTPGTPTRTTIIANDPNFVSRYFMPNYPPVNGFFLPGGTYVVRMVSGAVSWWPDDSADSSSHRGGPGQTWGAHAIVAYYEGGGLRERYLPGGMSFYRTAAAAESAVRGQYVTVKIDPKSSHPNLYVFMYDITQSDSVSAHRGSEVIEIISCVEPVVTIVCGNGVKEAGELCDLAAQNSNSPNASCRRDCQLARCGDGIVDGNPTGRPREECDRGTGNGPNSNCTDDCKLPKCGNGVLQTGEQCEVGIACSNGHFCNISQCQCDQTAVCGNGKFEGGGPGGSEECESFVQCADKTKTCIGCRCVVPNICGNLVKDPGEDCDDGNKDNDDTCTTNCKRPVCGDGFLQPSRGEQCDGTNNPCPGGQTCDPRFCLCVNTVCGNGRVDPGEECDDGDTINDNVCSNACKFWRCGDGILQSLNSEQCDDGNAVNDDACPNSCRLPRCGDGVRQANEECDNGVNNSDTLGGHCRTNCTQMRCGDGKKDPLEGCDAGTQNGVVCTAAYASTCTYCSTQCTSEVAKGSHCGDGVLQQANGEECDNGVNNSSNRVDSCRTNCKKASCGDGVKDTGEQCDDAAANGQSGHCTAACSFPQCGNGVRDAGEDCDDGRQCDDGTPCTSDLLCVNKRAGSCLPRGADGCSANCRAEGTASFRWTQETRLTPARSCSEFCVAGGTTCVESGCASGFVPYSGGGAYYRLGDRWSHDSCSYTANVHEKYCCCRMVTVDSRCGDGVKGGNEECDDGTLNGAPGDACTANCTVQPTQTSWRAAGTLSSIWPMYNCAAVCRGHGSMCMEQGCAAFRNVSDQRSFSGGSKTVYANGNAVHFACSETMSATTGTDPSVECCCSAWDPPVCGNNVKEWNEVCDGSLGSCPQGLSCVDCQCVTVQPARCGDRIVQSSRHEECDDGNTDALDGCSPTCTIERCGDRKLDSPAEQCDNGRHCAPAFIPCRNHGDCADKGDGLCYRRNPSDFTQSFCEAAGASCTQDSDCAGKGDERCLVRGLDGCSATCQSEQGWTCTWNAGQLSQCTRTCGNGTWERGLGEECDDGVKNGTRYDECSSDCRYVQQQSLWREVNPPLTATGSCTARCAERGSVCMEDGCGAFDPQQSSALGGEMLRIFAEDYRWHYGCTASPAPRTGNMAEQACCCRSAAPVCGDGVLEWEEECDDGNTVNDDGCYANCRITNCGDGKKEGKEECDSGGSNGQICVPSYGGTCRYCSPVCKSIEVKGGVCGDGLINGSEQCDQGVTKNGTPGVPCSVDCKILSWQSSWHRTDVPLTATGSCVARCAERGSVCVNENDNQFCDNFAFTNYSRGEVLVTSANEYTGTLTPYSCLASPVPKRTTASSQHCCCRSLPSVCGNGVREWEEECDDGNMVNDDACPNTCSLHCGDGVKQADEECDDGNRRDGDGCPGSCKFMLCGNGKVDIDEQCDDGNDHSNDGCSPSCRLEKAILCGNGRVDAGEQCDDGLRNGVAGNECTATCQVQGSQRYWINSKNLGTNKVCSTICATQQMTCVENGCSIYGEPGKLYEYKTGGGTRAAQYDRFMRITLTHQTCAETPALVTTDGTIYDTSCCCAALGEGGLSACGNGVLSVGEGCDDGNTMYGDGCSTLCMVESGWDCSEQCASVSRGFFRSLFGSLLSLFTSQNPPAACPSACTTTCGDRAVAGAEVCDDGNTMNGDGCSASCTVEPLRTDGWVNMKSLGHPERENCASACRKFGAQCAETGGAPFLTQIAQHYVSFTGGQKWTSTVDGMFQGGGAPVGYLGHGSCVAPLLIGTVDGTSECYCSTGSVCGNNTKETDEECDGRSTPTGRTCTNTCKYAVDLELQTTGIPQSLDDNRFFVTLKNNSGFATGVRLDFLCPVYNLTFQGLETQPICTSSGSGLSCALPNMNTASRVSFLFHSPNRNDVTVHAQEEDLSMGNNMKRIRSGGSPCSLPAVSDPRFLAGTVLLDQLRTGERDVHLIPGGHRGGYTIAISEQGIEREVDPNNQYRYSSETHTLAFASESVPAGTYDLYATWVPDLLSSVPIAVRLSCTGPGNTGFTFSQQRGKEPSGPVFEGRPWQNLGAIQIDQQTVMGCSVIVPFSGGLGDRAFASLDALALVPRFSVSSSSSLSSSLSSSRSTAGVLSSSSRSSVLSSSYSSLASSRSSSVSSATLCGDGVPVGSEACDDGNRAAGDGCSAMCSLERGWTCVGSPSVCQTVCGDGVTAGLEQCDDGNRVSGDGCSVACMREALFDFTFTRPWPLTVTPGGEAMQYLVKVKNTNNTAATNVNIALPIPQGLVLIPQDGGVSSPTSAACVQRGTQIVCGPRDFAAGFARDYVIGFSIPASVCGVLSTHATFTCDQCNPMVSPAVVDTVACAGSSSSAVSQSGAPSSCGNRKVNSGEECDDGNTVNNDGCSAACRKEALFRVTVRRVSPTVLRQEAGILLYFTQAQNVNKIATTNLRVTMPFPSGFNLNTTITSRDCRQSGAQVICSIQSSPAGYVRNFVIAFNRPQSFCGSLTMQAVLASDRSWPLSSIPVIDTVPCQTKQ
ncbi:MAG: DUF4215 domain-containing protein [Candidatus Peregrinibacteria bacterium]